MSIACNDRQKLRNAIVAYMNGAIATFAFDDLNCECSDSADESVHQISKLLYQIHDDTVDHPICVTQSTWDTLRRVVAFLDTELTAAEEIDESHWPFPNSQQWHENQHRVPGMDIPTYDPAIHARPVHGPFDRIPTLLGVGIILVVIGLGVLVVCAIR